MGACIYLGSLHKAFACGACSEMTTRCVRFPAPYKLLLPLCPRCQKVIGQALVDANQDVETIPYSAIPDKHLNEN